MRLFHLTLSRCFCFSMFLALIHVSSQQNTPFCLGFVIVSIGGTFQMNNNAIRPLGLVSDLIKNYSVSLNSLILYKK